MVELQMWKMKKVRLCNDIQTIEQNKKSFSIEHTFIWCSYILFSLLFSLSLSLFPSLFLLMLVHFVRNCKHWNESNLISVFVTWKMIMFHNLVCTTTSTMSNKWIQFAYPGFSMLHELHSVANSELYINFRH